MPLLKKKAKKVDFQSAVVLAYWLWGDYLKPFIGLVIIAVLIMMVEGAMTPLLARMVVPMFQDVFAAGDRQALYWVGAVVMGIFAARAVTSAAQKILLAYIRFLVAANMRKKLLTHLLTLDSTFFQTHPPGELITRVQGDVQAINVVWTSLITAISRDLISLIGLFAVAIWIDWYWTLIAVIGIPVLLLPSIMVQTYIRKRARETRVISAKISTRLDEAFHGINPIKLNSLENYQTARYDKLLDGAVGPNVKTTAGQAAVPSLVDLMTGIGFFGVFIFGGAEIISGEKQVAEFMGFFTAMGLAFDPVRRLAAMSGKWQKAAASIERLQYIFDVQPTILSPADPVPAPTGPPQITLDDVHMNYGDFPVLKGASFTAEAGKTTALVGASGAGKSTVFNVLTRLVETDSGEVKLNDVAVNAMALADLRGLFSVVSQDAALFDESIRDNILLGRTKVDEVELDTVLKAAHITEFVEKFGRGLNEQAGPRGSALSGGQRQRVAIARALLRDTPILLLDEATSELDTKSETIVQSALEQLSSGRTTIVIAHRLSTVRNAHSIVVMDQGRVVDQGTHEELIARGGIYADLHRLQFSEDKAGKDD